MRVLTTQQGLEGLARHYHKTAERVRVSLNSMCHQTYADRAGREDVLTVKIDLECGRLSAYAFQD